MVGFGECLRNGADELAVSRRKALLDESGKPPMKLTPVSRAAFSSVFANITGSPFAEAASIAIGVTDILLFIIGISVCFSILFADGNEPAAKTHVLS